MNLRKFRGNFGGSVPGFGGGLSTGSRTRSSQLSTPNPSARGFGREQLRRFGVSCSEVGKKSHVRSSMFGFVVRVPIQVP